MKGLAFKEIFAWVKYLIVVIVICLCFRLVYTPVTVQGGSMEPTLQDGDRVIVSKLDDIERFDQVIFHAPDIANQNYIKRVIGLPGDSIEVIDGTLYINSKQVDEPYLKDIKEDLPSGEYLTENFTLSEVTKQKKVPEGKIFVLGDNRLYSNDSRYYGFISIEQVIGKVNAKIWPLKNFQIIDMY